MPPVIENFLRMEFAKWLTKYASNSLRFFRQVNQNLHIFQVFCEFQLIVFFLPAKNENCLVNRSTIIIIFLILYKLATMSPFGWHPPNLVDNTDALYMGDQQWQQTFLIF